MKRSKYVQLSLAASVALAVAGCGAPEKTYQVKKNFNFQSVAQCTAQQFPVDVCSDAYIAALNEHRRTAPVYDSKADCEADFVPDYCQVDSDGKFMPQLGGFELDADGTVTQSQLDEAKAQVASSGGGGGFNGSGLLTGLLIGHMLSNRTGNIAAAPVYQYRDDRGNYASSTLGQRVNNGATFSRSRQSEYGGGYSGGGSGFGGRSSINANPVSVRQATTRGGFGSSATARSGWGGSSSSRSSFGG